MRSARSLSSVRPAVADKREAILRAATRVFARNGYFNSKVADIASAAGVADGTVYLYFKSKEEILHSIFDRTVDEAVTEAREEIKELADPREKLRRIAHRHLERLGADRDLAIVFQVELRGSTKFMEEFSAAGFAAYLALIRATIEEGQRAGEWLVKQSNGKAGIVELTGTAGSSVANDRSQGFKNAIKDKPEMQIIASQTGDFTRATAQKVMENIIQSKGKEITAVYAHNDEMALGAIQALQAAGMKPGKDVMVVSVDGEKAALQAIAQGTMNVSVECNPRFGPIAFDTLEKHLNGEKVPTKIIVPDRFFDQSNAQQFVNEAY